MYLAEYWVPRTMRDHLAEAQWIPRKSSRLGTKYRKQIRKGFTWPSIVQEMRNVSFLRLDGGKTYRLFKVQSTTALTTRLRTLDTKRILRCLQSSRFVGSQRLLNKDIGYIARYREFSRKPSGSHSSGWQLSGVCPRSSRRNVSRYLWTFKWEESSLREEE